MQTLQEISLLKLLVRVLFHFCFVFFFKNEIIINFQQTSSSSALPVTIASMKLVHQAYAYWVLSKTYYHISKTLSDIFNSTTFCPSIFLLEKFSITCGTKIYNHAINPNHGLACYHLFHLPLCKACSFSCNCFLSPATGSDLWFALWTKNIHKTNE